MKQRRRKTRKFKALFVILLILIQLVSVVLASYSIILYKGIETFYRAFGILILVYLFFFFSYLLLRSIKRKSKAGFVILVLLSLIISAASIAGYYYLTKVYKAIDQYSDNQNMYYSSIVTYDKTLKSEKDLKNKKIGIVDDSTDIEGNILPTEIIEELKLDKNNKI